MLRKHYLCIGKLSFIKKNTYEGKTECQIKNVS